MNKLVYLRHASFTMPITLETSGGFEVTQSVCFL